MSLLSVVPRAAEAPFRKLVETHGSPLLVLDCEVLRQRYRELQSALPGVELFYAIKSMSLLPALRTLRDVGASFDVATSGEIELLRQVGVGAERTIHTHPIKRDQDIRDALDFGCRTFVVDNLDELHKFTPYAQQAELLLRVSFRGKDATCDLSRKFGCGVPKVLILLEEAARLGIRVKGLSFHVGSQSTSPEAHVEAIDALLPFFTDPIVAGTEHLAVLDIGGGFPADYRGDTPDLARYCAPIMQALAAYPERVRVIAEPGRVLSAPCITSVSTIVGRALRGDEHWYYLDDGVYGGYSGTIFDHAAYPMTVFSDDSQRHDSVLAGPTCDSIDVVLETTPMPPLAIGDLLVGRLMGAYSIAHATEFNSIPKPKLVVTGERA